MSTASPGPPGRLSAAGVGQPGFVARHGLFSDRQARAAELVAARIDELGLRTVRLVVVDQHGIPRSKSLSADAALAALANGLDFSGATGARRAELARYGAALAENPPAEGQEVSDWEMREYFEFF